MRKGNERRLRHDVGAKAASVTEADTARGLVDDIFLQYRASDLIGAILSKIPSLPPKLLSEVAHKLINDSLERFRG